MTAEESRETVEIMLYFLSPREARAWALTMWERVGSKTENSSVRETLKSILDITETNNLPPLPMRIYLGWLIVFVSHWAIALANLASSFVLVWCGLTSWAIPEWAIACPLVTLIIWTITSRTYDCPLSVFEDKYRGYFGLPPLKAFLSHYLVRPLRRAFTPESGARPHPATLAQNHKVE